LAPHIYASVDEATANLRDLDLKRAE